jgi:predicted alpha-1,2-mannosidase
MVTRRRFLQGAVAAALAAGIDPGAALADAANAGGNRAPADVADGVSRYVDVFVGTGGHGHTYPGATVPWGMVQLSPDTNNSGWDACSGYHQADGSIMGFSHTHLSGTGGADMLDVLVMPAQGPVLLDAGARGLPDELFYSRFDGVKNAPRLAADVVAKPGKGYRSRYDKASERAVPGYYTVRLTDHDIVAELTATARTGLHRYTFRQPGAGHLLIDLAHGYQDKPDVPCKVTDATLRVVGNDTLVGSRRVHEWANGRSIFFALKVSQPFARAELFSSGKPAAGATQAGGASLKAVLHYADPAQAPLLVKVGISGVDVDGALRNLETELPDWNFERVQRDAAIAWEHELSRIRIASKSDDVLKTFYSGLYHTMVAPTLFSDVDGRYRGMDLLVHTLPQGRHNYSTWSLWDTYRALHPLYTLFQPDKVPDLIDNLVLKAAQSPNGPAVWPLQSVETGTMPGYHSVVLIAETQAKGFTGIDYASAWPAYRDRALASDWRGLGWYRKLGYVPSDMVEEGVSRTLEYAYDDWALAHLAAATGHADDAKLLRERSRNYGHVFNRELGFMCPRAADGQWLVQPFDPREMGHSKAWRDYTESNPWEATFLNQHDLYHYMPMFGGDAAFERKLDELFTTSSALPADAPPDIAGMVGQYAQGNEPSHHVAYLYAYCGAHWKTQARVRMLLETMYLPAPDGLAGNEDCGQMSAWYVLSALGLYEVDPVSAEWVFGSPLVEHAEIDLGGGKRLVVDAHGNGKGRPYIQSVTWNGKPWTRSWIAHAELAKGGTLVFEMGPQPNKQFGTAPADRPPSFGQAAGA